MQKTSALALLAAALLLVVPAGRAKTVVVRADWEKARTLLARGDFRPRVRVELKSAERVKGKLFEATSAGLRLGGTSRQVSSRVHCTTCCIH